MTELNGTDRPLPRPRPQFEPRQAHHQVDHRREDQRVANHQSSTAPLPQNRLLPQGAVPFGVDAALLQDKKVREVVYWHPESVTNHHLGIAGGSGTGKTYWLKKLIAQLPQDVEVEIFDWHGDIELDGEDVTTCRFSTSTKYGYNPLILNTDPEHGGVRRGVQDVIDAMNSTSVKLGPKQEFCLRNLLLDTYAKRGIVENQPDSWKKRIANRAEIERMKASGDQAGIYSVYPTIEDVQELGMTKLKALYLGATDDEDGGRAVEALTEMGRATAKLAAAKRRLMMLANVKDADLELVDKLESARDVARAKSLEAFDKFIHRMATGREFEDHVRYQSKDTIQSVLYRLDNLVHTGIFDQNPPPFGISRIRRYFLRPLAATSKDELTMFIRFRLRAIIREMMQDGHVDGRLRRVIVLDEAKQFADDNPENPLNVIACEMRKFGLGLWLSSQSVGHYPIDFTKNAATIVQHAISPSDYDGTSRVLGIDKKALNWLRPQESAIVRMTEKGKPPRFRSVLLRDAAMSG